MRDLEVGAEGLLLYAGVRRDADGHAQMRELEPSGVRRSLGGYSGEQGMTRERTVLLQETLCTHTEVEVFDLFWLGLGLVGPPGFCCHGRVG